MAYNRRQQRRQGIRYGPPRERERLSDNGVLIGRFLGLGILLLSVGLLAAGALAFMGDRPGAVSTPGRSSSVPGSPRPSNSTLTTPTATSTSLATGTAPAPTTAATPATTHVPPLVHIGEGYVTFGTDLDAQSHVTDPRSTFSRNQRIAWSAYLSAPADSTELRVQILKLDDAVVGGERLILDDGVPPFIVDAQIFTRRIRPQAVLDGPGVYVVRYLRETELLSEGFLEIID